MSAERKEKGSVLEALRKAVELCMPNLRHYYRMTKKAKVVAAYPSDGQYFCDVQPLRNDESDDQSEPVVPRITIPVLWGGPDRGVVCPPMVGVLCDLSYYDGDPNYPFISNIRWGGGNAAPKADLNEFVIQCENGVEIRIDKEKQIITLTPENVNTEAGKNWTVQCGDNATIEAGKNVTITAGDNAVLKAGKEATMQAGTVANIVAPLINLLGRIICKSYDGGHGYAEFVGDVVIRGNEDVKGDTSTAGSNRIGGGHSVGGSQSVGGSSSISGGQSVGGNSHAASRSGGPCPH